MAVTVSAQNVTPEGLTVGQVFGSIRVTLTNVTLSASYPTGGESVTAAQLGLNTVVFAVTSPITASAAAVSEAPYLTATSKLKALTTTAEVANTTDCSGITVAVLAFGY